MKYMFLIYSSEQNWTQEEWNQCTVDSSAICFELASQGKFIAASPLHPVTTATSVRVRDEKRLITDGPFAETTEQLGGYYIVDVENLDEAIAIAARLPPARKGTVEIRPIYELPPVPIPDACEIMSSRDFSVSREELFAAFADPDRLARWWGPNGFTNSFRQFQFKPGGVWQFTMHGPDGRNYDNDSVFESIVPNEQIVVHHRSAPEFRMTMTYLELPGNKTRLVWRMRFDSVELRDNVAKVAGDGNEQNFDRLTAELSGSSSK